MQKWGVAKVWLVDTLCDVAPSALSEESPVNETRYQNQPDEALVVSATWRCRACYQFPLLAAAFLLTTVSPAYPVSLALSPSLCWLHDSSESVIAGKPRFRGPLALPLRILDYIHTNVACCIPGICADLGLCTPPSQYVIL